MATKIGFKKDKARRSVSVCVCAFAPAKVTSGWVGMGTSGIHCFVGTLRDSSVAVLHPVDDSWSCYSSFPQNKFLDLPDEKLDSALTVT